MRGGSVGGAALGAGVVVLTVVRTRVVVPAIDSVPVLFVAENMVNMVSAMREADS